MMLTDVLSRIFRKRFHDTRIPISALLVAGFLSAGASQAVADTVTATWDRNPESNVAGYILSYGTQAGTYPNTIDVGNVTTKQLTLNSGQKYYFVVQAYNTASQVSPRSAEASIDLTVAVPSLPSLTSLSPTSGTVGTAITINGLNLGLLQGISTVRFNGVVATPTSWNATRIVAPVPAGATSGLVTVTVVGILTNGISFTVLPSNGAPTLTQPANQTSVENTNVSLALVGSDPDGNPLTYSATGLPPGLSVNASSGVITGTLTLTSAGTHTVTATVSDGSLTNSKTFTWTVADSAAAPNITSVSPTSGAAGTSVTINGANFGNNQGSSTVRFNGTVATATSWNASRIVTSVPAGATSGSITVTVNGVPSNGVAFTVPSTTSTITLLQHRSIDAVMTSGSLPFTASNSAGNFIAVVIRVYGLNPTLTVADSRGNTYRRAVQFNGGSDHTGAIYYAENIATGSNTVTVSATAPITLRFSVLEYAGVATSGALEGTVAAQGSSGSANSGTLTTTTSGALLLGAFTSKEDVTFTPGAGYTIREGVPAMTFARLMTEDRVQASAGAASASATLSSSYVWGAGLAAFKKAGSGGSPPPPTNAAPTLTQPANQTSVENTNVSLALVGSDPDGNPLTYSATGLPPGLSVNASSGVITGTLTLTSAGTHTVTATVSDGSLTNSKTFTWTVADSAAAPNVTSVSPTSGAAGTSVTINGANFGNNQGSSTVRFNGTVATATSWNASRIVTSVPAGATSGSITVTVNGVPSNGVAFTVPSTTSTITLLQHRSIDAVMTSGSLPFTASNSAGNFIAVVIRVYGLNPTLTVADSRGNTYRRAVQFNGGSDHTGAIYYAENIATGSNTVTVSATAPITLRFSVLEYAGVATSGALEGTVAAQGSSGSANSGTLTTTTSGALLLGAFTSKEDVTFTPGAGYTIREGVPAMTFARLMTEDRVQASAGAASASATLSSSYVWGAGLAAFKKAGSALLTQEANQTSVALAVSDLEGSPLTSDATGLPPSLLASNPAVAGDIDGDGMVDVGVYRPSSNEWRILRSSASDGTSLVNVWGETGAVPVSGDFDGDGISDLTYYMPSTGVWSILKSSSNYTTSQTVTLGTSTDIPVAGDYDGDSKTDVAVYQPSTGRWQVLKSTTNFATNFITVWGAAGDLPVPGDYDGDQKIDLAVYRPGANEWRILRSSMDFSTSFTVTRGTAGDVPVPADYDGDGRFDIGLYRPSNGTWYMALSTTDYGPTTTTRFGSSSDTPIAADFDGDGMADLGLFNAGSWNIRMSGQGYGRVRTAWGTSGDIPLPKQP